MLAGTNLNDTPDRDGRGGKRPIHWTQPERDTIVQRAADLRAEDPSLAGLPLLRKALHVLPVDRRRGNIRSLAQVPWFEEGLKAVITERNKTAKAEMKRQRAAKSALPVLKEIKAADEGTRHAAGRGQRGPQGQPRAAHRAEDRSTRASGRSWPRSRPRAPGPPTCWPCSSRPTGRPTSMLERIAKDLVG